AARQGAVVPGRRGADRVARAARGARGRRRHERGRAPLRGGGTAAGRPAAARPLPADGRVLRPDLTAAGQLTRPARWLGRTRVLLSRREGVPMPETSAAVRDLSPLSMPLEEAMRTRSEERRVGRGGRER